MNMQKSDLKKRLSQLDLFLIDIDDTVAPHRTVGIANNLARDIVSNIFFDKKLEKADHILTTKENIFFILNSFFKKKIKLKLNKRNNRDLLFVFYYGAKLHILKFLFNLINATGIKQVSNEVLINNFLLLLKKTNTNMKKYQYNQEQIQNSLYSGVEKFLKNIKTTKIAMSQSFDMQIYKKLSDLDQIFDNQINKINIKNSYDKYHIAKTLAKDKKAIGILMNDYEDEALLSLPNVKLVIMKDPPLCLRKKADLVVKKIYDDLL